MKNILTLCLLLSSLACRPGGPGLHHGAVSAATPEAARAGMHILRQGGNAADAAIAISFALAVSEPAMSGLGGGCQVHLYLPGQAHPFAINGSTRSPAATPTFFPKDSLKGHLRSTIPSTVKVMQYLYEHYGSKKLSWEALLLPAIEIAEEGFVMGPFRSKVYARYEQKLARGLPATSSYYPLDTAALSRQPQIAQTLRLLAREGAETFYEGKIAASIARDMQAHGGWMNARDLEELPMPETLAAVHFRHNGYEVYTQPEPCGGWVVKEILQKLSALRAADPESDELQTLIRAINYGHEQRKLKAAQSPLPGRGETTHFSVMDAQGMCLSVTASINAYYGAGVANPDYGFLYNSYMDDFDFEDPTNKYAIGPHKMAYSSMSPTIVMKNGKVVLIIGSPGSARIISTVAQLIDAFTLGKVQPEHLLELPRVHARNKQVWIEDEHMRLQFEQYNQQGEWEVPTPSQSLVQNGLNAYFGGVHAIVWTGREYLPLADPRRDGLAMAE